MRGAVGNADGPAHEGLFPADALLELLSFLPHKEVRTTLVRSRAMNIRRPDLLLE